MTGRKEGWEELWEEESECMTKGEERVGGRRESRWKKEERLDGKKGRMRGGEEKREEERAGERKGRREGGKNKGIY